MAKYTRLTLALSSVLGATLLAAGCGDEDPIDEIEQIADCAEICDRYDECVEELDMTACVDACEDRIEVDATAASQAQTCEECLDDRTCAEVETANCFDACPVVPLQD